MTFKKLLCLSLATATVLTGGLTAACVLLDPFYLFGRVPTRGADVSFYDNERLFKYWLAQRFVPEAYRGVILGPSYTASLDPASLGEAGEGIYNLSFRGANSVEMLTLGEAVSGPGSRVEVAYLCVDPYVVRSVNPRTADMQPATFRMAYLSWPVLSHFFQRAFFALNPRAKYFSRQGFNDEYAYLAGRDSSARIAAELAELRERFVAPFRAKPAAVRNLAQLVSQLRRRGIRTVAFLPPKPAALQALRAEDFAAYAGEIRAQIGPVDEWLDLTSENFPDEAFVDAGGHLSPEGSLRLLQRLTGSAPSHPSR